MKTASLFAVVCAALALAFAPRPAAADDTLTIMEGSIAPALYSVADIVADKVGFFKAQHLIINQQLANTPSVAAALVASGKGDLCSVSAQAILQGYEKGLRLVYFMAHAARYSNVMAALDDGPIKTLADFKGKNVGITTIGGDGEVTAAFMLAGAGLTRSDFTTSPIGYGPQAVQAVVGKRVDGVAYPYGEVVPMEVLANVKMRVFRDPIVSDIANSGYATTLATIQTKGDLLKRYARAIAEASLFERYNPQVAALYFLQAEGTKITPQSLADKTREFVLLQDDLLAGDPSNKRIGYLSPVGLEVLGKVLNSYGLTHSIVPSSAIVTNQFIPYANDFDHQAVIAMAKHMHVTATFDVVP
jgi:ABC-type nitrate/sulfonate/bicarbonate transport system substrate-binding protein